MNESRSLGRHFYPGFAPIASSMLICFSIELRPSACGVSRKADSFLCSTPQNGYLLCQDSPACTVFSLKAPKNSRKMMLTCCIILGGLMKLSGMRSSQLFNLWRKREFYEDNNMQSLIHEELCSTGGQVFYFKESSFSPSLFLCIYTTFC